MPDVLQFVDAVGAAPTVRLDLNDDTAWSLDYDGTDMSPPRLRQAWASTLLTDGAILAAAAYDNRRVRLRLDLQTASLDAAYGQLQALHRELDRPANVLRWQPQGASSPVFFRTIRSLANRVVEYPGPGLLRSFDVEIDAEPFALGLKETVGPTAVSNNPAAAGGMYLDLPTIKGDVETPLRVSAPVTDNLTAPGQMSVLAVRRRGTPASAPFVLQAEAMSALNDTATQPNSATMSGAGNNFTRTTFATTTTRATRLTLSEWPAAPGVDVRGRYRVFAAVKKSVAGDAVDVWLGWGRPGSATTYSGDAVRLAATTNRYLADLGLISFPVGPDPVVDGLSGADLPVRGQSVAVDVARVSGSGTLDVDYLLFVPADDRMAIIGWNNLVVAGTESAVVDATTEQVYGLTSGGAVFTSSGSSALAGGFPMATPGASNRLYLLRSVGGSGVDLVTTSTAVTVEYWPRYLYARPATS